MYQTLKMEKLKLTDTFKKDDDLELDLMKQPTIVKYEEKVLLSCFYDI